MDSQTTTSHRKPPVNEADISRMLRLKDFYEILGVTKTSTEEEIKKHYKKLALRYHPDKLRLPGAQEVFKKIAQAYDCLTDPDKKAFYDRTGSDEPQQQQRYEQHYYQQEFDPNDIFNMFFGNGFAFQQAQQHRQRQQHHYENRQRGEGDQQQQRQGSKFMGFLQLLPFILIMFSGVFSQLFAESPEFSLHRTQEFNVQRRSVVLNLEYYINASFNDKVYENIDYLPQFEWKVEQEYLNVLRNNCFNQQNKKRQYQNQARMSWTKRDQTYYQRLSDTVDLSQCTELDDISNQFDIQKFF